MGPVDYIVVAFPGNKFSGEIAPALRDLVEKEIIRILDLIMVVKDSDGNVEAFELQDMPLVAAAFEELTGETLELLNQEDAEIIAESLEPESSAAILVFENTWASQLSEAVRDSEGQIVAAERIPAPVVEQALAALAEEV